MISLRKTLQRRRFHKSQKMGKFRGGHLRMDAAYQDLREYHYKHRQIKNFFTREERPDQVIYKFSGMGKLVLDKKTKTFEYWELNLNTKKLECLKSQNINHSTSRFFSKLSEYQFYPFHNRSLSLKELLSHGLIWPWFEQEKYKEKDRRARMEESRQFRIFLGARKEHETNLLHLPVTKNNKMFLARAFAKKIQRQTLKKWYKKLKSVPRTNFFTRESDRPDFSTYQFIAASVALNNLAQKIKKFKSDIHLHVFFKHLKQDLGEEWINKFLKMNPRQSVKLLDVFDYAPSVHALPMEIVDVLGGVAWSFLRKKSQKDDGSSLSIKKSRMDGFHANGRPRFENDFSHGKEKPFVGLPMVLEKDVFQISIENLSAFMKKIPACSFQTEYHESTWLMWPKMLKSDRLTHVRMSSACDSDLAMLEYRDLSVFLMNVDAQKTKKEKPISVNFKYLFLLHGQDSYHEFRNDFGRLDPVQDSEWHRWCFEVLKKLEAHWKDHKSDFSPPKNASTEEVAKKLRKQRNFFFGVGLGMFKMQKYYMSQVGSMGKDGFLNKENVEMLLKNIEGIGSTLEPIFKSVIQENWLKNSLKEQEKEFSPVMSKKQRL